MPIPVANLYYLLCYAWDRLEAVEYVPTSVLEADRPEDLFGRLLREGVARALRRGLDRQYVTFAEDLSTLRGKIDVSTTVKRMMHETGRARCEFDELSHDVAHNRIIKATLRRLGTAEDLDRDLRRDLVDLARRFGDVSDVAVSARDFRRVQLHRNNAHYRFLLHLCELVLESWLPDPTTGRCRFHDFTGSEAKMGGVFERFVRNFLRREQAAYRVGTERIAWDTEATSEASLRWLPQMRTDVSLWDPAGRVVIETKYYLEPLQRRYDTETIRSQHLYQLFAYLRNLGASPPACGMLLYARVADDLRFDFQIQGHRVLVRALDLDQPWMDVRGDLLRLVEEIG